MRKALNQPPSTVAPAPAKTANRTSLVPMTRGHVTTKAPEPVMEDDVTYKRIIDEKPPKSDVLQYFRNRIDELKEEKDL